MIIEFSPTHGTAGFGGPRDETTRPRLSIAMSELRKKVRALYALDHEAFELQMFDDDCSLQPLTERRLRWWLEGSSNRLMRVHLAVLDSVKCERASCSNKSELTISVAEEASNSQGHDIPQGWQIPREWLTVSEQLKRRIQANAPIVLGSEADKAKSHSLVLQEPQGVCLLDSSGSANSSFAEFQSNQINLARDNVQNCCDCTFVCLMCLQECPIDGIVCIDLCDHSVCHECMRLHMLAELEARHMPCCPCCTGPRSSRKLLGSVANCVLSHDEIHQLHAIEREVWSIETRKSIVEVACDFMETQWWCSFCGTRCCLRFRMQRIDSGHHSSQL